MQPDQSETGQTITSEATRAALVELEARGARAYDAPACDCVDALLSRAEELGGGVATRLVMRAEAHVNALRTRFEADSARVSARVLAYEQEQGEQADLQRLLAGGDLARVARRVRRLRASGAPAPRALALKQGSGGYSFARMGPPALRRKRVTAYEDSVAQLVATLALARATDVVPEDAGPYNPLRIASDVLERMRAVSPFYLAVQLNRLEELASLLSLPELPESESAKSRLLQQAEAEKKRRKSRLKR